MSNNTSEGIRNVEKKKPLVFIYGIMFLASIVLCISQYIVIVPYYLWCGLGILLFGLSLAIYLLVDGIKDHGLAEALFSLIFLLMPVIWVGLTTIFSKQSQGIEAYLLATERSDISVEISSSNSIPTGGSQNIEISLENRGEEIYTLSVIHHNIVERFVP